MQPSNNQNGFTIIEVILFLAISSLMVTVAMVSIRGRTQQVQFTDSVRAMESFFQSKISQIDKGSVARPDANCRWDGTDVNGFSTVNPSDGTCIFLGYMFEFNTLVGADATPGLSEIYTYQMFGARLSSSELAACSPAEDTIACVYPIAIPDSSIENFKIPWALEVTQHQTDANDVSVIGFMRDPNGTSTVPISIATNAITRFESNNDTPLYRIADGDSWIGDEFNAKVCFTDDIRTASINFGQAEGQLDVAAEFNDAACPAP